MEIPFPYINAYGSVGTLFGAIKIAAVPPKFNQNFLSTMLGLKSSSHRALIPLLKKLEFIDQDNIPTDIYKQYRNDSESKGVMGLAVKKAYADLFISDEYAYKLTKEKLQEKIKTITGMSGDNKTLPSIVSTFLELTKLSDFEGVEGTAQNKINVIPQKQEDLPAEVKEKGIVDKLGISYTINLNLPATTDIEVFNSIFKSLKNNLLDE